MHYYSSEMVLVVSKNLKVIRRAMNGISIALIIHSLDPSGATKDLNRSRFGDRSYKIRNSQQRGV